MGNSVGHRPTADAQGDAGRIMWVRCLRRAVGAKAAPGLQHRRDQTEPNLAMDAANREGDGIDTASFVVANV